MQEFYKGKCEGKNGKGQKRLEMILDLDATVSPVQERREDWVKESYPVMELSGTLQS